MENERKTDGSSHVGAGSGGNYMEDTITPEWICLEMRNVSVIVTLCRRFWHMQKNAKNAMKYSVLY